MFITFEGVEGSGKSTQAKKLAGFLNGQNQEVVFTREPGGTPVAEKIRALLLDRENSDMHILTELLLYAASRSQHVHELIKPALLAGKIVICDRFFDSMLAYQGYGRKIDQDLIRQLNQLAVQGVQPDITFILDVPAEQGLERTRARAGGAGLDRLELEDLTFHRQVRAGFLTLGRREPERIKIMDGLLAEDEIFARILKTLKYEETANGNKKYQKD